MSKLTLAAAGLVVLFGSVAYAQQAEKLRQQGRAEVAEEQADSLREVVARAARAAHRATDTLRAVRDRADSAVAAATAMARRQEGVAFVVRQQRDSVVAAAIAHAGADSVIAREAIASVRASYEAEVAALQGQVNAVHAAMVQHEATIYAMDTALLAVQTERDGLRALNTNLQQQIDGWHAQRGGGFTKLLATGAVGFLAGALVQEMVR